MRPLTLFVLTLCAVLASVGGINAFPYSLTSSASTNALQGVSCGPYGQQCPDSSPICCGDSNFLYCVAAGSTCCTPRHPLWTSSLASCAQGEVCCAGDTSATCCRSGSTCVLQKSAFGVVTPHCVQTDVCNTLQTADACLNAAAGEGQCGWCCEEQRCISSTDLATHTAGYCMDGRTRPIEHGQQCPSRCSYASTCALCEGAYQQGSEQDGACAWCCASMTCMPAEKTASQCENHQRVAGAEQCDDCLFAGHGVNERLGSDVDNLLETIFMVLLVTALIVLVVVWRIIYDCAFGSSSDAAAAATAVYVNPQEAVRRYGFARTDRAPSSPVHRHHGDPSQQASSAAAAPQCAVCARVLSLSHLQAQLHSSSTDGARPAPRTELLSEDAASASPSNAHSSTELPEASTTLQEEANSEEAEPCVRGDGPVQTHEGTDESVAIFLPCEHIVCFHCLGVNAADSGPSTSVHVPQEPSRNAATTTPQTGLDDDAYETLLLTRWGKKCPFCHNTIEDTIIPNRIISL